MATISDRQKIRAKITVGDLETKTPDVVSFSVKRARNQPSASFSASLRIKNDDLDAVGVGVVIEAGLKNSLKTIFNGVVEKAVLNPIRTDASMVMLNISGRDAMRVLETQKINRRVQTLKDGENPPARYGVVNSVVKHNTAKTEQFKIRIQDKEPKAVQELPKEAIDKTPPAYTILKSIEREKHIKAEGSVEVTKLEG